MIRDLLDKVAVALCMAAFSFVLVPARAQVEVSKLPKRIYVENSDKSSHVQGIAVDTKRGYAYFSFTTKLIKTDLQGNVVGSVTGLTCHLGCIDLNPDNGKLYASVEYKDDVIGRGILKQMGKQLGTRPNTFYIGIFDTEKIDRPDINAETGGVMTTVFLPEVVEYYEDSVMNQGRKVAHRYGCSGIDGISLGPQFGKSSGKLFLNVDAAVYGDVERTDNDYQVLLQFDPEKIEKYARPLDQARPHRSGPKKADKKFFAFTGNTEYGIQNLEYDAATHYWICAVYKGKKKQYPNYGLYAIDGTKKAAKQPLKGFDKPEKGLVVSLAEAGSRDEASGVYGWKQYIGSTGIESLGNGYFYISKNGRTKDGREFCDLRLFKWTGRPDKAFEEVE